MHPQSSIDVFMVLPAPTDDDRKATETLVYALKPDMVPAMGLSEKR